MDLGSESTSARNPRVHCAVLAERGTFSRGETAARRLGVPPLAGRRLPEYPETELREVLERPYRLIYQVKPEKIEVITVKHYRQRLPRNSKRLTKTR